MYSNNSYSYPSSMRYSYSNNLPYNGGDRLIGGGFLGPFILGGITGGLLAPGFGGYGRPCCNNNYYYPGPYYGPPYGPPYYR